MRTTDTMVTAEQFLHMPRGEMLEELVHGAVVTMPPPGFELGQPERTLTTGERLEGGAVLPGWSLELADLFA